MTQIWKPSEPKSDKLVLIKDNCIYKGNPEQEVLNKISLESENIENIKNIFSIPFAYIKRIENQKNSNRIKIYLGSKTEEEIILENETQKNEIFHFLRHEILSLHYRSEFPSIYKYAKPQVFGLLIATAIFIWAMYFAIEMSKGYDYQMSGGGGWLGIIGMMILLAKLGIPKLIIGYSIIAGLTTISLRQRLKSRSEIEVLER